MEGREEIQPIIGKKAVANLERIVKMLAEGKSFDLKLNGRRVFFTEGSRLEITLENDPRSGDWEIDIRWGDRKRTSPRPKIRARVLPPLT